MGAITTVAAIAGIASQAGSAGMSFAQASKQKKLQARAEQDAREAMAEARSKLDVNFAEQMSIQKEAYDLERDAMLSAGAQATQAGIDSERGAAATAGRVYAGQQKAQANVRTAMGREMQGIQQNIIEEDSRLRDAKVDLDLAEVKGQQQMAADAQRARTAAMQQGIESAIGAVGQGLQMAPLYGQDISAQRAAVSAASDAGAYQDAAGNNLYGDVDFGSMSNRDFRSFRNEAGRGNLFQNQAYIDNYNNPFNYLLQQQSNNQNQQR